jgi:hypothetical protein
LVSSKVDWETAVHVWKESSPVFRTPESSVSENTTDQENTSTTNNNNTNNNSQSLNHSQQQSQNEEDINRDRRSLSVSTATYPEAQLIPSEDMMDVVPNSTTTTTTSSSSVSLPNSSNLSTDNNDTPVFRVTGKRIGNQKYKSPQIAGYVGAGLIARYGWKVDLRRYNMEILADLNGETLVLGISLSHQPSYHSSSPPLLKPSIAYW